MLNVAISVTFDCETREEIDAVLAGINAPEGANVLVNASQSAAMEAPDGGGSVELPPAELDAVPTEASR